METYDVQIELYHKSIGLKITRLVKHPSGEQMEKMEDQHFMAAMMHVCGTLEVLDGDYPVKVARRLNEAVDSVPNLAALVRHIGCDGIVVSYRRRNRNYNPNQVVMSTEAYFKLKNIATKHVITMTDAKELVKIFRHVRHWNEHIANMFAKINPNKRHRKP